ncbi:MAG: indolepyruvate ferredoxin oxidoreductase subunit alpha [Deltaproteobacteria bacterium]|nr:indolepyruvate ferredoxin oxidoreductase subunit alpha [Deltaproteobacteria bacterium]
MDALLADERGRRALLLGNEAIVRGAIEAGVEVACAYPGTPSSEIADTFYRLSQECDLHFEYAVNEKVALELAAGAAIAGMRSMVSMKHVGLNVAADPLNTLAYTGVRAGMVVVTADDPSMHSSQNEQDNRFYAKLGLLPMLEPSDPLEALEMTREAFRLSERFRTAVLLRTTTRVNHTRGVCTFGPLTPRRYQGHFEKNPFQWVPVPAVARKLRPAQLERARQIAGAVDELPFNRIEGGESDLGIVASGVAYAYVKEVLADFDVADRVRLVKVGSVHPVPRATIERLLLDCKKVLVVEELEPFLETDLRAIAQEMGRAVLIFGKGAKGVPRAYELSPDRIRPAVGRLLGQEPEPEPVPAFELPPLPTRPPMLCAGCTHRNSYYAIKSIAEPDTYFASDIGCYTLGLLPPMSTVDSFLCMGSSITQAQGAGIRNPQKIVAFIGDSTFFHSGLTGLVNAIHNGHDLMLVILDNSTTAMTGHQPHPGTDCRTPGAVQLDLERVVRGLGVDDVQTVDPNDLKAAIRCMQDAYHRDGVRVVISRHPCPLYERRRKGKRAEPLVYTVDHERCRICGSHADHEPCAVPVLKDDHILRARTAILAAELPEDAVARGEGRKMEVAPCTLGCPANVCVFGYVGLARAGRYDEALDLIREQLPLPRALGHVCHHPCESACIRADYDAPVAINAIKRFVAERESPEHYRSWLAAVRDMIHTRPERVAVVGAGPAGLSAAFELRKRGYEVSLLERERLPGGMLALGIPAYRMPRKPLQEEIEGLLSIGIDLQCGKSLGRDFTLRSLLESGFEAVCLATGAWQGVRMGIEGEEAQGVEDALGFLKRLSVGDRALAGRRVLVVGGGDAAIDAARSALRLGAESVEILYRRSAQEMPASDEEVEAAMAEGVKISYLTLPTRLRVEGGRLIAAHCVRTELGEPDASGRRRPVAIAGSDFERDCDQLISAVGQQVEPGLLDGDLALERRSRGEVICKPTTGQSSEARVFAAGDLATGPLTVIHAIASGRKAAYGIDRFLSGGREVAPVALRGLDELEGAVRYHPPDVQTAERIEPHRRPPRERAVDFEPEGEGYDEHAALAEADRCLSCQLCGRCNNCIDNFGCPAIFKKEGRVYIDEVLCVGCGICAQLCPNNAIRPVGVEVL